jgi:hypothetical protein
MNARVFTALGIIGLGFAVLVVLADVVRSPQTPGVSLSKETRS